MYEQFSFFLGEPYVESRGTKVSWRPRHTGDIYKYNKENDE